MGSPYLQPAIKELGVLVPRTEATALSRESSDKCAIACKIGTGLFDQFGIEVDVRVFRTKVRLRVGDTWYRYQIGEAGVKAIRKFDDPEDGVFPETLVRLLPPKDYDENGKVKGGGHGKDAPKPRKYVVDKTVPKQNHNRRISN